MIILQFLILLLIVIFSSLYFLFMINIILMRSHDLPTSSQAIKEIIKMISEKNQNKSRTLAKVRDKNNLKFYDLGSGKGNVLIAIKKTFPEFSVIGIEKSFLQIFFAKLKSFILRQDISFQKTDLFKVNLEKANIVYTYLWYDLIPGLEKKLKNELKPGAVIITNTSNFPNWQPEEVYIVHPKKPDFEKLFVYIKKD